MLQVAAKRAAHEAQDHVVHGAAHVVLARFTSSRLRRVKLILGVMMAVPRGRWGRQRDGADARFRIDGERRGVPTVTPWCTAGEEAELAAAREATAWPTSSRSDGIGSSSRGSGASISRPSGSKSNRLTISSAPDTPSTAQWCILVTTPMLPSASPPPRTAPTGDGCGRAACWRSARRGRRARGGHRARDPDPADVVVEVEVGSSTQIELVQTERHLDHPAPERRHEVEPRLDELLHLLERVPVGHRGRVEDRRACMRRLEVEGRVHARESFHGLHHWARRRVSPAQTPLVTLCSWPGLLILGVLGVVHAVNAMAPRKGNPVVFGGASSLAHDRAVCATSSSAPCWRPGS